MMKGLEMIVSRCCRKNVWVHSGGEGTSYYVCGKCDHACDTLDASDGIGISHDDAEYGSEAEALPCSA